MGMITSCHNHPDAFGVLTFKGDVPRCLHRAFVELVDHSDAIFPGKLGGQKSKARFELQTKRITCSLTQTFKTNFSKGHAMKPES
jgi:hypothetical protein